VSGDKKKNQYFLNLGWTKQWLTSKKSFLPFIFFYQNDFQDSRFEFQFHNSSKDFNKIDDNNIF
jgi:hypothetical protein